jgi:hypothetical protein
MLSCWTFTYVSWDSFVEDPNQVVMDETLQDPLIKHTYQNLPWVGLVLSPIACVAISLFPLFIERQNLLPLQRTPRLAPLSGLAPGNVITFARIVRSKSSLFELLIPHVTHMNFRRIVQWLTFQKAAQYVNLSRVDPELLDVVKPGWGNNEYLCLPGQTHGYCVAVSLIKVESCNLVNARVGQNSTTRRVAGVLHAQEMQRLMGCAGLLFGFNKMICSMYGWTMLVLPQLDLLGVGHCYAWQVRVLCSVKG